MDGKGAAAGHEGQKRVAMTSFLSTLVSVGVEGGTPLRLGWVWPPWDSVLNRSPTAGVGRDRKISDCRFENNKTNRCHYVHRPYAVFA
eukprot:COSAG02_NODE_6092_length_3806_cov_3.545724_5_plen_88_part_00